MAKSSFSPIDPRSRVMNQQRQAVVQHENRRGTQPIFDEPTIPRGFSGLVNVNKSNRASNSQGVKQIRSRDIFKQ